MAIGKRQVERRPRGSIDVLPSGAMRVRVHAGTDPVTKRRLRLTEIVPAGADAAQRAEEVRARLVREITERRNPRTAATIDQLLERYLDQLDVAPSTLRLYRGHVRRHVSPFLGAVKVAHLDPERLDAFYAELRRCRNHCDGAARVDHRTPREHTCDDRCGRHRCRPLAASTVRHIHFILSGAYQRAVRWRWVSSNPLTQAEPPAAPKPNPQPPSAEQAASILNAAWGDPDWGALLWVAMTTGARRGELCAVRWSGVTLHRGRETLWLRRAIAPGDDGWIEGDLKTHQQRRIALDPETVAVLKEHRARYEARARALGAEPPADGYVFGRSVDGQRFSTPDSVTQRYDRLVQRLRIETTFHKLRHYSATELIVAGVDVRTVAGRLGHGGGGVTTLRTYTAWVSEADQRAAAGLGSGMPSRPEVTSDRADRTRSRPRHPYEKVAAAVADDIDAGTFRAGEPVPTAEALAAEHSVSLSTARRAVSLLKGWQMLIDGPGRPIVTARPEPSKETAPPSVADTGQESSQPGEMWRIALRGPAGRYTPRVVTGSPTDLDSFRRHLVGIARIEDPENTDAGETWIDRFELDVMPVDPRSSVQPMTLRW